MSGSDETERGAEARLGLLARVGEILGSGLRRQETLDRVADLLVPSLADWCAIDLATEDGVIARHVSVPPAFPFEPDAPHGAAIVMRTGEAELVPEVIDTTAGGEPIRSAMTVPLSTGGRVHGAISLLSTDGRFGAPELELACEIARRTAATIEIERSEQRYRMLFEASPLPMWLYDSETLAFVAVNDAAIRHYGYSRDEFLAMTIKDIRPPEDVPALLADVHGGGPGSPVPNQWRHRRRDGSLIDVEISAGRITFEGRPTALVLVNDVSERKRLERRLVDAEKMEAIGRLAGGVAHDFNNLLTVIAGYAEILLARDGSSDELVEISRAAGQAAALTRQLLAFSRRQVLHPRVLDLNEIVGGMEAILHRIIGDDVSVGISLAADLSPVEADRAQIERVILNLAANARDAMPEGGALTIETANVQLDEQQVSAHGDGIAGPHVLLAVSDTGHGMDENVRKHLFEPFFTTKSAGAGTGLGLATVFGVVKQSGGGIYVYSEPGRGTTFKIYLPAAVGAQAGRPAAEPAAERGSETIMIVEDDDGVRELVRVMLESHGYEVLTAQDADEAARVCTERPSGVDLLLTDVVMPEVNGRVLAERLGALAPAMRILFMSGYSGEAIQRHGVINASAAFLEKPFTEHSLARKVREVLDA